MRRLAVILGVALLATGCGGGSHESSKTIGATVANSTTTATTSNMGVTSHAAKVKKPAESPVGLRSAVRATLLANHRLAVRVLWTNKVPASAVRSTRGPALEGMRGSATGRQKKRVRVRMLHDDYRIVSVGLEDAGSRAVALAHSIQKVELTSLRGVSRGRAITLDERARIVLHRVRGSDTFVVWRITLVK
jgi:hypothetical protein